MRSPEQGKDRYLVPGLVRGLSTLKLFTPETPNLSLSQIAASLGITRSAAFRTVYTLAAEGCLLHDERTETYALGPGVMRLTYGYFATREVVEISQPELEKLRSLTGWSVHLGVLDGTSVLYVMRLAGPKHDSSIIHVGSRLPARATTLGRVLLSGLSETEILSRFRVEGVSTPKAGSASTIARQARADAALPAIVHLGDFQADIISAAAPIRNMIGDIIAAVNLTAPNAVVEREAVEDVRKQLIATTMRISTLLGWDARG
ncbi:IclR family transcriptional regulator [Haematobacter genomosp. 1]|uniref:IclR family transcriptional regulator n=1 Tax=Haematobacter genomosp. 1 TaxID=366618 RepID=A0A212A7A0_9RHOB|nr:IclR family transcriptional regulator [Haematobacter genomosp. 1]OWJ75136.1 IclR family transcriptional regulator [Haematobacter genomosp. 1]